MSFLHIIPFAVLGASLLGSGHCIAMCGGLVFTVARGRQAVIRYHLGRLLGYCGLGALAGFLGETVLKSESYAIVPWIATILLSLGFVLIGVRLWAGKPLHFVMLPNSFWKWCGAFGPEGAGLMSAFLPCGWLHTFVLGAVATQSPGLGAMYLFVFWLGTLPALTVSPLLVNKVFTPIAKKIPRLSAVILIAIGIFSLGVKMLPPHAPIHHCTHELEN